MADNWTGSGYDVKPSSDDGVLFYLKEKDQEARLRLCTGAYRYLDSIVDKQTGLAKELRKIAWGAILKEVVDGQPTRRAVIFQASPQVYGFIKDLHDDPDWGDPTAYDIKVARPETTPIYYSVTPVPNKSAEQATISDADRALLVAAKCSTVAEVHAFICKLKGEAVQPIESAPHTGANGNPEGPADPRDELDDPFDN